MPRAEQSGGWVSQVIERSKKAAESGPKPMMNGQMRHLSGEARKEPPSASSGSEGCHP